jgi:sterol desaturase/sphingolipid hydroxylase (fatty acid hydroxylase superfamily)
LNEPQGWLRECWAYIHASGIWLLGASAGLYWLAGFSVALGWLAGGFGYLAFSAYTHMLYHIKPNLVFWVKRPTHLFHHEWSARYNFGVTTAIWDHVFGTYRDEPHWKPERVPLSGVFGVPWL